MIAQTLGTAKVTDRSTSIISAQKHSGSVSVILATSTTATTTMIQIPWSARCTDTVGINPNVYLYLDSIARDRKRECKTWAQTRVQICHDVRTDCTSTKAFCNCK